MSKPSTKKRHRNTKRRNSLEHRHSQARKHRHEHPHLDELREKAHEKAQEPKTVHGHTMPAADIFKIVGLVVFFAIMALAVWLIWPMIHEAFEPGGLNRVMTEVRNAGFAGAFLLLAFQFLQVVVAFIPGEVVQVAAGLLYGPWVGALIIFIGCIISSAFVFLLVSKLGAPFVRAMVPEKYMDKFDKFEESGKLNAIVFILFLIPGMPKDVFTYLVPLTKMPLKEYLLITNVARIPGIVVSTYAANGIAEGDYVQSAIIFAVVAAVAIAAMLGYSRIMNVLQKHAEAKSPTGADGRPEDELSADDPGHGKAGSGDK